VKKPKWLGWGSSETKSDDLKKVRRQTDQRMNQQDVQKAQRDEAEKKNRSPSLSAATYTAFRRRPLLDVQLADQSRAEKTRSKSLDLTNHLPSRLSTMNWIGAVI
jgi:hypothetical protein